MKRECGILEEDILKVTRVLSKRMSSLLPSEAIAEIRVILCREPLEVLRECRRVLALVDHADVPGVRVLERRVDAILSGAPDPQASALPPEYATRDEGPQHGDRFSE